MNGILKKIFIGIGKLLLIVILAVSFKSFMAEIYSISSASMFPTITPVEYVWVNKFSYRLQSPEYFPLTNIPIPNISCKGLKDVQREDVVMFKPPKYSKGERTPWKEPFVKRCAGLPGDAIEIRSGLIYINGKFRKPFIISDSYYTGPVDLCVKVPAEGDTLHLSNDISYIYLDLMRDEGHNIGINGKGVIIDGVLSNKYIVRKNYYFMLGDNSPNSIDSREWGFLPEDHLIGQVWTVVWSYSEYGSSIWESIRWGRIGNAL